MARRRDRGPCVTGVRIRYVRAVSIGASSTAEREEEINERTRVATGEVEVRISLAIDGVMSSSGNPTMAESRLRMKVFRVGRSSE
jgi:hypothetical protein